MGMNFSGKDFLLQVLTRLSTQMTPPEQLVNATDHLRAGLMLHGSTSEDVMPYYDQMAWCSDTKDGQVWRQGIALRHSGVFLSDLMDTIWQNESLKHTLRQQYQLTDDEYEAAMWTMNILLEAMQMFTQLLPIENQGDIDFDTWTPKVVRKLELFMNELEVTKSHKDPASTSSKG